ncbi:MAG TPA: contact-dependent growth inhibition system immunity protein [Stellaceae bacterium]|jgi:hypothetical protein|nr:contact-dependent growth inhibition system immunity protein [Stellaceae bacterium]
MISNPRPFAPTATIYRSDKFICIEALSGTGGMTYREDEPYQIYLQLDATVEDLGRILLEALGKSRHVTADDFFEPDRVMRRFADWQKDFAHRHGAKRVRDAFKNVDWCMARIREDNIVIQPHRREKPGSWHRLPPDSRVIIPRISNAPRVGTALRLALDRCE